MRLQDLRDFSITAATDGSMIILRDGFRAVDEVLRQSCKYCLQSTAFFAFNPC
jgi:hypothetical protein